MLYALIMGAGRGTARNPSLSFGGSNEHSLFSKLDPIGNFITGIGGDPLNLYGNKDNPHALLFPGPASPSGASTAGPAYTPMQSGMSPQQMAMLSRMGAGANNPNALSGAYNNYLSAIGQPRMPVQRQPNPGMNQLQSLMQSARAGSMPMQRPGFQPVQAR